MLFVLHYITYKICKVNMESTSNVDKKLTVSRLLVVVLSLNGTGVGQFIWRQHRLFCRSQVADEGRMRQLSLQRTTLMLVCDN